MIRRAVGWLAILAAALSAGASGSPLETAERQFDTGDYPAAIGTLQAAAQSPQQAQSYYWLGRCYYELRDYSSAIAQAERAVKLDPQNSDYHLWLGRAYGQQADRAHSFWLARKTKHEFEAAVQLNPKNVVARRDLMEFYASAPWIVGGSKEKAQEQLNAIAALDRVEGALARAEYWKDLKRYDQAEAEYHQVMQMKPNRVGPYLEVADFCIRINNPTWMTEAIEDAAAVNPSDPRLGYYRGVVRIFKGDHLEDAEAYLKSYLATTPQRSDLPSHAEARTWLGRLYEREGKRLEAAEQYRAALQLDPDRQDARANLQRLEKQSN